MKLTVFPILVLVLEKFFHLSRCRFFRRNMPYMEFRSFVADFIRSEFESIQVLERANVGKSSPPERLTSPLPELRCQTRKPETSPQ
jgi:hypothetical protein